MTVLRRSCFVALLMLAAVPRAFADDAAAVAGCGTNGATSPKVAGQHVMPPGSYPLISTVQGEQGTVLLGFTIQPDGSVNDVHVDKTSGFPRLDEAAAENVKAWRYDPSEKDGKPIACLWKANVAWKLYEAEPIFPNAGPFES